MDGVVNELPVPKELPPVLAAYQLMLPDDAVAFKVTVPVPHLEAGVVLATVGTVLTVANTAVLDADTHPSGEVASA